MVESIYFLKPAWCGSPCAGLWPEQGLQPVRKAFAFRRWFVTRTVGPASQKRTIRPKVRCATSGRRESVRRL
jgi:hypothetical protein